MTVCWVICFFQLTLTTSKELIFPSRQQITKQGNIPTSRCSKSNLEWFNGTSDWNLITLRFQSDGVLEDSASASYLFLNVFPYHRAMNDPLRSNVAIAARCHLTIPDRKKRSVDYQSISVCVRCRHISTHTETPRANIFSYWVLEE